MSRCWPQTSSYVAPWDAGVAWFSRRIVEPTDLPIDVTYVTELVLKSPNGDAEQERIERLIRAATQAAEDRTQRALCPQTWQLVMSGFPSGGIRLPRPPLISVTGVGYLDEDGTEQTLDDASYVVTPSGNVSKAVLTLTDGASWPSTVAHQEAVTVTYRAGYVEGSPETVVVPDLIIAGICLMVGELYKTASLSKEGVHIGPSVLNLEHFWRPVY